MARAMPNASEVVISAASTNAGATIGDRLRWSP